MNKDKRELMNPVPKSLGSKYSISQRRGIYQTALNYFLLLKAEGVEGEFICVAMKETGTETGACRDMAEIFPELYAQRPKDLPPFRFAWYDDTKAFNRTRIQALEKAIELTYKKQPND